MANQAKEKYKKKNTKEKDILDLDNEIIIGIKTLPNDNIKSKKKVTSNKKKKNNKKAKSKPKKTKKQQEIDKKKRKIIIKIIKWTTLVALIIGGIIYFLLSPFFNIKIINTSGNEKITKEELISLSNIQIDENIFKISNKKVEQNVRANAYIDSIKIKRKLPDTIELQIIERKPAYMITIGNAYMYVNTQGHLLEISKQDLKLPIITGYLTKEDQIQVGNRLCEEDLQKLSSVIQIMNAANSNEIGKLVTKINISDKQDYVLELKSEKKTVHVGDTSDLSTKMLYVKTVLEKEKKHEGEIFVNTDLSNKGAVFREKV